MVAEDDRKVDTSSGTVTTFLYFVDTICVDGRQRVNPIYIYSIYV